MPKRSYCHSDSDDPCVPDDEALDKAVEELKGLGEKLETPWALSAEEIEELYAEAEAESDADADEDDDDEYVEDDHDGEFVSKPYDVSYQAARIYHFYDDSDPAIIENPVELRVSETGDHLITVEDDDIGVVIPFANVKYYEIIPRAGHDPFGLDD